MGRELKDNSYGHKVLLDISVSGSIMFGSFFLVLIFFKRLKILLSMDYQAMKRSHQIFILLLIYLLTLGIRIYWLTQKGGFHLDEAIVGAFVCSNYHMYSENYELNREYTGKKVREITYWRNDSIKNVFGDIYRLYIDYGGDNPHTNLHKSLLRLSLIGSEIGNMRHYIFRGGVLNLVFFTISFIFFFLLMKLFFINSKLLQISATACTFLSTATISNTLFIRPYQIQQTMFIVFCYYFFKTFSLKKYGMRERSVYINTKLILFLSLVTAFTLLTGYYAIILIGLFGLYVVFKNIKTKNYAEIGCYIVILLLSLLLARLFYARYLDGFISGRALETKQTLFADIYGNIASSITSAGELLIRHFFTFPVIIVLLPCIIILICRKQKLLVQTPALFVFVASILFVMVVLLLAPYKNLNYVMPIFPFLIFLPSLLIYSIQEWKMSTLIALLLCEAFSINALNQEKIEYLYRNKSDWYYFNRDTGVPVYVINSSIWKYGDLVPYFSDEQVYYFFDNYEDISSPGYNEFYLIVEKDLELSDANLAKYETEQEFTPGLFVCRKLRLTEINNVNDS